MNSKYMYVDEKFSAAVRGLAIGLEPIQVRVSRAFQYDLSLLTRGHDELPADIASTLAEYERAWGRGTIEVWSSGLTDDEARSVADWIVQSHEELSRLLWSTDG